MDEMDEMDERPWEELTPEEQKKRREEVYRIRASDPTPARVLSMPPGVSYDHLFAKKKDADIDKGAEG